MPVMSDKMIEKEEIEKAKEILSNQIDKNLNLFYTGNMGVKFLSMAQNNINLLLSYLNKQEKLNTNPLKYKHLNKSYVFNIM